MSANIFNERFYAHRVPAWHNLGVVSEVPMGAQEAFSINPYSISLQELSRKGSEKGIGKFGIFREPTPDDKRWLYFGIVSPKYVLLEPNDLCRIFDEEIGVHIETLGAIDDGQTFFLTTKLPTVSVSGDEIDNYIVITNTWSGGTAMRVRATPVRVVCQNTLIASRSAAAVEYSIRNVAGVEANLRKTIKVMYRDAKQKVDALRQLFEIWASKKVPKSDLSNILFSVYPEPEFPEPRSVEGVTDRQERWYQMNVARRERDRSLVSELFNGAMTGYDAPAIRGTVWGLYNAFAEYENYRRGHGEKSRSIEILQGCRADKMEMAFAVLQKYAKV